MWLVGLDPSPDRLEPGFAADAGDLVPVQHRALHRLKIPGALCGRQGLGKVADEPLPVGLSQAQQAAVQVCRQVELRRM